jgi:hypothetical protein
MNLKAQGPSLQHGRASISLRKKVPLGLIFDKSNNLKSQATIECSLNAKD